MTLPLHPAPLLLIYPLISSLQSHWPLRYSSSELLHSHGFCLGSPYPQSVHGFPSHGDPSNSITTPEAFLDQSMALSKGAPLPPNYSTSSTVLFSSSHIALQCFEMNIV